MRHEYLDAFSYFNSSAPTPYTEHATPLGVARLQELSLSCDFQGMLGELELDGFFEITDGIDPLALSSTRRWTDQWEGQLLRPHQVCRAIIAVNHPRRSEERLAVAFRRPLQGLLSARIFDKP